MLQRKLADRYGESLVVRRSWYQAQSAYVIGINREEMEICDNPRLGACYETMSS